MAPSTPPSPRRRLWRPALLLLALVAVSLIHYLTPPTHTFHGVHDVARRLYYAPILMGALWYGLRGGVGVSLLATVFYLPHVLFQWGTSEHGASANQYLEIVMFNVIGLITGLLAREQHRKREAARRAYEQLAESFERSKEAERLAAMGTLSAALAHEIRNPLASLQGALPILMEGVPADDPRQEFAGIARKEIGRLEELTGNFLAYARPPRPTLARDSLNDLARQVARLVEKQAMGGGVRLELALDEELPLVPIDSNRMSQVLLNLALNGLQAMPKGGTLTLATGRLDGEIWLRVVDEGEGLTPEARERCFEPFFSTKAEGTGLGLAVAHQWVHRMGGRIEVESERPRGTRFTVVLPLEPPEGTGDA